MMKTLTLAALLILPAAALAADPGRDAADLLWGFTDEEWEEFLAARPSGGAWTKKPRVELAAAGYRLLAKERRAAADALAPAPEAASRGAALSETEAKALAPDAELLSDTGWWSDLNSYVNDNRFRVRTPTAIAGVRGGRKLSTESDKAVSKALAKADAAEKSAAAEGVAKEEKARLLREAGLAYSEAAGLVSASAPARAAKGEPAREAADLLLALSDDDWKDLVAAAKSEPKVPAWASRSRESLAADGYRALARERLLAAAKAAPELERGAALSEAEAKALSPEAERLSRTGWWSDFSSYVNNDRYRVRTPAAVAAVRGGRKLSTENDKAVSKALAKADAAEKSAAAQGIAAEEKARLLREAGLAYSEAADLVAAAAEVPAAKPGAPVAAFRAATALSAQEIYKRAAPSTVLVMAAGADGQGELGTGSVIDADGRVLTNAHVVIDDKTGRPFPTLKVFLKPAKVTGDPKRDLSGGIPATVAKFDRPLDLAVLTLERAPGVAAIPLGDDSAVEPGDPVVAIGHPEQGGLWTLTQGVVSTVVADLGGVAGKHAFQTDASINRGNSGGPLLDRRGSLIGVNTSMARKAADGLTITSVNFSVRSSVARAFLAGAARPAAAEPDAAPEPSVAAPSAPAAEPAAEKPLPPPPATKPVIVTPVSPYKIEDAIAEGIKEMEDLESEMREEIRRRATTRPSAP